MNSKNPCKCGHSPSAHNGLPQYNAIACVKCSCVGEYEFSDTMRETYSRVRAEFIEWLDEQEAEEIRRELRQFRAYLNGYVGDEDTDSEKGNK